MNHSNHLRKHLRLTEYDYKSPGAYFVTIVTHQRETIFGEITDGKMKLNQIGYLVDAIWRKLSQTFPVELDEWVIMPDHLHAILWILDDNGKSNSRSGEASGIESGRHLDEIAPDASPLQQSKGTKPGSLGAIIQNFKSLTSRRINALNHSRGAPVWQPNYYERVIRTEIELNNARNYIIANPLRWPND